MKQEKHSLDFGKKEKVLNYACQTYQLSRPSKVGAVMALIRECQPNSIEEWEKWFFENAYTTAKMKTKITKESLEELGERLYEKITEVVIPEWQSASNFGGYSATERMKASFADFEEKFGGKVFVVFSLDGEIANKEVITEMQKEIERLH